MDQFEMGMKRWLGKVVLVTGATTGIGKAISEQLVVHGMKVVGCARSEADLKALEEELNGKSNQGHFLGITCDVSKEPQVKQMFNQIKDKYGGVDVCINNAGLLKAAPILTGSTADWQTMLDVNVLGVLIVTREAFTSMKAKNVDEGHIINIASLAAHRVPDNKGTSVYSATKFALNCISSATRLELTHEEGAKIRVSQISAGLVETPFVKKVFGEDAAQGLFNAGKALQPDDVAQSAVFQLSLPAHAQVQDILLRGTDQPKIE